MNANLYDMILDSQIESNIETYVCRITPELAAAMLENSAGNRTLKRAKLASIKMDLEKRDFVLNGETVKLHVDETGNLILDDGHHRLTACIESGCGFDCLVVINAPDKRWIDNGTVRNFADSVTLDPDFADMERCLTSTFCVAVARVLIRGNGSRAVSNAATKDFILEHADAMTFAYNQHKGSTQRLHKSGIWAAICAAYESGYEFGKLASFCRILKSGEYETADALPIIRFRNWCLQTNTCGGEAQKEAFMRAQYALESYEKGNSKAKSKQALKAKYNIEDSKRRNDLSASQL